MSQVEFDGDEHSQSILYAKLLQQSNETPSLINWLTKTGIAKSPEAANKILVGVMVVAFVMTGWTVYSNFGTDRKETIESQRQAQEYYRTFGQKHR